MDCLLLPEAQGLDGELEVSLPLKRKISLCSCGTCGSEEAKYKCPRCMKYSCSLPCVKKHKVESACNGVRDKTAFVPLNTFGDIDLLNDYRFLEDAGRVSDCALRDSTLPRNTTNKHLNFLKNRARDYDINLKILPIGFSKRRANTTCYNKREKRFFWHLKLVFPHCKAEYTEKRVPDDRTLGEILKHYIDPTESDPTIRQRLKEYVGSSCDVKVFMEAEKKAPGPKRYDELDTSKNLRENFKKKTIMEFPTLYVTLKGEDMGVVDQENRPSPSVL
ncbi:box C/D snoRNA protein 1 [Rana temporaria]|uniref:box C/D snoRNA protein 1 n=1 Tax=Rana temporaria TaxID=8407 RepID=UPI001AAC4D2A|nr:box C/D snoRNA protein 1 [Rana temporaria]